MTDYRMDQDNLLEELDLLEDACGYDPLEEEEEVKDADERAETFGYIGTPEEAAATPDPRPQLPARERIERLFADMPPFKVWFLALLEACKEPKTVAQLDEMVEGMKAKRHCVYTAPNFCAMLCDAGAFKRVTDQGEPYEEVEPQLEEVEEDGRKFLRPVPAPEALWQTTEEALQILDENDPVGTLVTIVDEQARYASVFREILEMCDGDGSSINQIKDQVNSNPVLEYPKKTAQFFMDYLDRNGAIEWDGAWKVTQVGRELMERLDNE